MALFGCLSGSLCVSSSMGMLLHRRWCFLSFPWFPQKKIFSGTGGIIFELSITIYVLALLYTFSFGCPFPIYPPHSHFLQAGYVSLFMEVELCVLAYSIIFLVFFSFFPFPLSRFGYFLGVSSGGLPFLLSRRYKFARFNELKQPKYVLITNEYTRACKPWHETMQTLIAHIQYYL